jgi:hypothetical protein
MMERVAEDPAREGADISASIRDGGTAGTPPPSSVVEEENRSPSPARVEEPSVEVSTQEDAPDHGKGPLIPSTVVGGSAEGGGTQAVSDDEVEEIQGHPHDGRQHIYVWRQRGDHWADHEEIVDGP